MSRYAVRIARNFERNIESIERFLRERDAPRSFDALLERLFGEVIPNLERFPEIGHDLLARQPRSAEGISRQEEIESILKQDVAIREYISGDYLLLYAVHDDCISLLSIKHHLQLSFDLKGHRDPPGSR